MKTLLIFILLLLSPLVFALDNLQKASELIKQKKWEQARSLLKPIANKGHHQAQYLLATTYSGKNELQAFKWYMKSAKLGNDISQLRIGKMYSFGMGVKQNTTRAIFWYKQSAKRGNKTAKQSLDYLLHITQNKPTW